MNQEELTQTLETLVEKLERLTGEWQLTVDTMNRIVKEKGLPNSMLLKLAIGETVYSRCISDIEKLVNELKEAQGG